MKAVSFSLLTNSGELVSFNEPVHIMGNWCIHRELQEDNTLSKKGLFTLTLLPSGRRLFPRNESFPGWTLAEAITLAINLNQDFWKDSDLMTTNRKPASHAFAVALKENFPQWLN